MKRKLFVAVVTSCGVAVVVSAVAAVASFNYETHRARRAFTTHLDSGATGELRETSAMAWCKVRDNTTNITNEGICLVDDETRNVYFWDKDPNTGGTLVSGTQSLEAGFPLGVWNNLTCASGTCGLQDEDSSGWEGIHCDTNACWVIAESDKTGYQDTNGNGALDAGEPVNPSTKSECRSVMYRTKNVFTSGTGEAPAVRWQAPGTYSFLADTQHHIQLIWRANDINGERTVGCNQKSMDDCDPAGGSGVVGGAGCNAACNSDADCGFFQGNDGLEYPLVCSGSGTCQLKKGKMKRGGDGVVLLKNGHVLVVQQNSQLGPLITEFAPTCDTAAGYSATNANNNGPVGTSDAYANYFNTGACAGKGYESLFFVKAQWREKGGSHYVIGASAGASSIAESIGPRVRLQGAAKCDVNPHFFPNNGTMNDLSVVRSNGLLVASSNSCRSIFEVGDELAPDATNGFFRGTFRARRMLSTVPDPAVNVLCTTNSSCATGSDCVNGRCVQHFPLQGGRVLLDPPNSSETVNHFIMSVHDGGDTDPSSACDKRGTNSSACTAIAGCSWNTTTLSCTGTATLNGTTVHKDDVFEMNDTAALYSTAGFTCQGNCGSQNVGGSGYSCDIDCFRRGDCVLDVQKFCRFPAPRGLSAGYYHTIMQCTHAPGATSDYSKAWGANDFKQIGDSTTTNRTTPTNITLIDAQSSNVIRHGGHLSQTAWFLDENQRLAGFGRNDYGQTGRGVVTALPTPLNLAVGARVLRESGATDPNLGEVFAFDASLYHACAIAGSQRRVYCWGRNNFGQLGVGDTTDRSTAHVVLKSTGGDLTNAVEITTGLQHTCARTSDYKVYCWGYGANGQLGAGTLGNSNKATVIGGTTNWIRVQAGAFHTCGIRATNQLACWGLNASGQLGLGNTTNTPVPLIVSSDSPAEIALGANHTCAILGNPQVIKCTGEGSTGELGNGAFADSLSFVSVATAEDGQTISSTGFYKPVQLVAGGSHTCALLQRTTAPLGLFPSCWGNNLSGQLGNGTTTSVSVPQTDIPTTVCD